MASRDDQNTCYKVLLKDFTVVSKSIHTGTKTKSQPSTPSSYNNNATNDYHNGKDIVSDTASSSYFKPEFKQVSTSSVFNDEAIELSTNESNNLNNNELEEYENIIIIDMEKIGTETPTNQRHKINSITSLSHQWQINEMQQIEWEFNDIGSNSTDTVSGILLKGSNSELVVEDDKDNDLIPKNDIEYSSKLVGLFIERNRQLNGTINLDK